MSWERSEECKRKEEEEEKCVMAIEGMVMKNKGIMVVIDGNGVAKSGMVRALTHVANKGDVMTLLRVLPPPCPPSHIQGETSHIIHSLGATCMCIRPQVRVEVLVIQGPKLATVLGQVKKLDVSVLVLNQTKPSPLCCMFRSSREDFIEQ